MSENEELVNSGETRTINGDRDEIPSRPFAFTMEMPLFLIFFGIALSGAVVNNLLLFRTCVNTMGYDESVCELLQAHNKSSEIRDLEAEVQKYATVVAMVKTVLESFFPAFLALFLGVWSDTYGRKPLVVWPLMGISLSRILLVAYSLVPGLGPWWYVLTGIPFSLMGGASALFTGSFCYINDITSTKDRSLRLSLLEGSFFVGLIFGAIASPYVLTAIGDVLLLLLTAVMFVIAYAFTTLRVPESLTGALEGSLCSVLDFLLVKEMFDTCFKKRPRYGRMIMLFLVVSNSMCIFVLNGAMDIDYFYVRQKLQWTLQDYTVFSATNTFILVFGLLVGVTFVQRVLRVSDVFLIIFSYLSTVVEFIIKAFATKTWHMYLSGSVSMFRGLSSPLIRSLLSKTLPIVDTAKVFALMAALEAILPVFAPLVYNGLYSYTITTFPGAVYMLSMAINVGCIVAVCVVQFFMWKYPTEQYTLLES